MIQYLKLFLIIFSGLSFLIFGYLCFFSTYFKNEFKRYGIPNFRKTTGFFQILGGISLIVGIYIHELGIISSLGLTILMLMGVGVRFRISDGLLKTMPAIIYAILNALIFIFFLSD
tara:strand:+ start:382 stop:729 length:348 start_codon:yes stop_codon:yes gene_type:complete